MLKPLHWLPVKARIEYKIALFCFNTFEPSSPSYIKELISVYEPTRTLRSHDSNLLAVPKSNLKRYGDRCFSRIGPTIWNSLPPSVRFANSVAVFKKRLKTHLFTVHL